MESYNRASAVPHAGENQSITRSRLLCGVLAGPVYLTVSLAQAFVRDGFDFSRHALSHLANGPGGWIQTANFALSGLMVIAAAVGLRRSLGSSARGMCFFTGAFGVSMIMAAIFPADPVYGFPAGTPETDPVSISTVGLLHFISGALGFISVAVACFLGARFMSRRYERALSRFSLLCGLVIILGFFGGAMLGPSGIAGIWLTVITCWVWLAIVSMQAPRMKAADAS